LAPRLATNSAMSSQTRNRILMLGDVMLGENLYHFRRGIRTKYSGRYEDIIMSDVRKVLFYDIDLLFFNLEYSLVPNGFLFNNIESAVYRGEVDGLGGLPKNVLQIANIANNHFSQHGPESAQFTKAVLRKHNILIVGKSRNPTSVEVNGRIIKFWGASLVPDLRYCDEYFLSTYEGLCRELSGMGKKGNEIWAISLHWGVEYSSTPSERQTRLAKDLVNMGFDIIIGHHPHVVQPLVRYGNGLVIFSLGNFISDQNFSTATQQGLAVKLDLVGNVLSQVVTTRQKNHAIVEAVEIDSKLLTARVGNLQRRSTFMMRLLMKLELVFHLWEVNRQTIKLLVSRFFEKCFRGLANREKGNN